MLNRSFTRYQYVDNCRLSWHHKCDHLVTLLEFSFFDHSKPTCTLLVNNCCMCENIRTLTRARHSKPADDCCQRAGSGMKKTMPLILGAQCRINKPDHQCFVFSFNALALLGGSRDFQHVRNHCHLSPKVQV